MASSEDNRSIMGPDEVRALQDALSNALPVAKSARSADHELFFQMLQLRDARIAAPDELQALLGCVENTSCLELFDHANQATLGCEEPVDFNFLVHWLLSRGQAVGAGQAVLDLNRYLGTDTLQITEFWCFDGFEIVEPFEIGEYRVRSWNDIEMSDEKWQVQHRALYSGHNPTAVLMRSYTTRREHRRPWHAASNDFSAKIQSASLVLDIMRCMTVCEGVGSRSLWHWTAAESWAPWKTHWSGVLQGVGRFGWPKQLTNAQGQRIGHTFTQLRARTEEEQDRLRVSMDRLNSSYRSWGQHVDCAIDLGIALESVFAPAKLSEGIGQAVRTRAARFLGGSLEERREIVKSVKDLYDLRSLAVHTGRFDTSETKRWRKPEQVREALDRGQALLGQSIVKLIRDGEPDWDVFDIQPDITA